MEPAWLFLTGLFSLIGFAVFMYGRRQQVIAPTIIGIALMGYPYFVTSYAGLLGVGVALLVALVVGARMENGP